MAEVQQVFTRMKGTNKSYQCPVGDTADTTISVGTESMQCTTGFNNAAKQIWGMAKRGTAYLHFKTVSGSPVFTVVVNEIVGGVVVPIPGARRVVLLSPDPNKLVIPFAFENLHPEATATKITLENAVMAGGSIVLDGTLSRIVVEV